MEGIKTRLLQDRVYILWARIARQAHCDGDFKTFELYFRQILRHYKDIDTKQKISHYQIDGISEFWGWALHFPWERIIRLSWPLIFCAMIVSCRDDGHNTQRFLYFSSLALMLLSSFPRQSLPVFSAQTLRGNPWTEGFAATLFAAGQILLQLALVAETFDSPEFIWTTPSFMFCVYVWIRAIAFSLIGIINGCNMVNFARPLQEGRMPRVDGVDTSVEDWLVYELLLSEEGLKELSGNGTVIRGKVK